MTTYVKQGQITYLSSGSPEFKSAPIKWPLKCCCTILNHAVQTQPQISES